MVIATTDRQCMPGAAVILFAETPDLDIIFGTHPTRKYHNLKQNPKAALAFSKGWQSLQMHGAAVELSGPELERMKALFVVKHPEYDRHVLTGSVFFKFTPQWMRFMDNGSEPPVRWEASY